jgi:hypothetical protein
MARWLLAGGLTAVLVGAALMVPAAQARLEGQSRAALAAGVASLGSALIVGGLGAVVAGAGRWQGRTMPSPVRMAVTANILFLAFFALEVSDGLVRRGGTIHPVSTALFLPTLFLLGGLLSGRRWAWWIARAVAAVFAGWFLAFVAVIPFAHLRGDHGPVPWYGRVWMVCVSLVLAGILAAAFRSLGRPTARTYFGLLRPERRQTTQTA